MPNILKGIIKFSKLGIVSIRYLVPACIEAGLKRNKSVLLQMQLWKNACCDILGTDIYIDDRRSVIDKDIDRKGETIEKRESKDKGKLYVHLNQQTLLSVLLYTAAIPSLKLIVNLEFALLPLIGWLQVLLGGTVIIRQFPVHAQSRLDHVIMQLKKGVDIGMSIEGKRSPDGNLSEYKKGAVVMAIEAQCDIIPFRTWYVVCDVYV